MCLENWSNRCLVCFFSIDIINLQKRQQKKNIFFWNLWLKINSLIMIGIKKRNILKFNKLICVAWFWIGLFAILLSRINYHHSIDFEEREREKNYSIINIFNSWFLFLVHCHRVTSQATSIWLAGCLAVLFIGLNLAQLVISLWMITPRNQEGEREREIENGEVVA